MTMREKCLEYALQFTEKTTASAQDVMDIATLFEEYLSGKPDNTDTLSVDAPKPPDITGPGMAQIRSLLSTMEFRVSA